MRLITVTGGSGWMLWVAALAAMAGRLLAGDADLPIVPDTWPHLPLTHPGQPDYRPLHQVWKDPSMEPLPGKEDLETITIRDKHYKITKGAKGGATSHEALDTTPFFMGSGVGGLKSKERLVVERCTFEMDFAGKKFGWDDKRCALRVQGYKEVLIKDCVFISKNQPGDEVRKTVGSIVCYDCVKVQVENCYFEGLTNWMRGHILAFCCGPTWIRNCEISGGSKKLSGGGIWIANGLGEGKIGYEHEKGDAALMLYPSGPALVENCWVHDQSGKDNTDGIYLQSVHNSLIRNCNVENWKMDGLLDVGYRDTGTHGYGGGKLHNHGAKTVIEHCAFSGGFIKNSVGAGGGTVFRECLFNDVYLMPYIFDGVGWFLLGNDFVNLTGPVLTPSDHRKDGWTPPEGMLTHGAKSYHFGNRFLARDGVKVSSLFITNKQAAKELIVSDANLYAVPQLAALVNDTAAKTSIAALAEWQEQTGNDKNSITSGDVAQALVAIREQATKMLPPGIVLPDFAKPVGLTGPVGFQGTIGAPDAQRTATPNPQKAEGKQP